jgi:uncharacterized protein YgiM (DUF1202 family)
MPSLFARRSIGFISCIAVLGLVAACQQSQPAPPPSRPAAPPAAAAAPPPVPMVTLAKKAHFREGPSTKAPIIATLPAGTSMVLIGSANAEWVQVSYQNRVGYVYGKLLKGH